MARKRPDPSVKDPDLYKELRDEGNSQTRAGRTKRTELIKSLREH